MKRAKPQTRFRRGSQKREWLSFIGCCLTKEVRSCKGPPDGSQLVYPYPSPQCLGGVGNAPVVVCFAGGFNGEWS